MAPTKVFTDAFELGKLDEKHHQPELEVAKGKNVKKTLEFIESQLLLCM